MLASGLQSSYLEHTTGIQYKCVERPGVEAGQHHSSVAIQADQGGKVLAGVRVLIYLVVTEKMGIPVLPAVGHGTHFPAFK